MQRAPNINWEQFKSIFYLKISHVKNENLLQREVLLCSLYFWLSFVVLKVYLPQSEELTGSFARIVSVYSSLKISLINSASLSREKHRFLTTVGVRSRNVWTGEVVFGVCYIFLPLFLNICLCAGVEGLVFKDVDGGLLTVCLGSLLFIINFTMWTEVLLITSESLTLTVLVAVFLLNAPAYVCSDAFLMNYLVKF